MSKGGYSMRILRNLTWALLTITACAAFATFNSCSQYSLYAPDGPIAKRVHDISVMCVSYLFEEGGSTISPDYDKYAPQLIKILNNEAGTLEGICKNPGSKYTPADVDVLKGAAEQMRKLSHDIQYTLDRVNAGRAREDCGSPWFEWTQLDHISKYIDNTHIHLGSKALYE
jgi:hypothetical protein